MADPYIGQIMFASFSFAPQGYALCNGASMPINQNAALYSLIGTIYGGDAKTVFNLPDLRGRTNVGFGVSPISGVQYPIGSKGGVETVSLTANQVPAHIHQVNASTNAGSQIVPQGIPSASGPAGGTNTLTTNLFALQGTLVPLSNLTVSDVGGGAGHLNMQPFQVISAIIAVVGLYPARP